MKLWLAVAGVFLAAAILLTIWIVPQRGGLQGPEEQGSDTSPPLLDQPYIRATHWFGEAWPVNFWNTDLESLARDHFQLMIDDGFNTVVFLVPWPGFAPDPTSGELEPERVERLRTLMLLANEMELKTIVRLSYAWDWLDRGSGKRLMQLWLDEDYRLGWLQYIEALWQAVGDVPGLQFGFFSWRICGRLPAWRVQMKTCVDRRRVSPVLRAGWLTATGSSRPVNNTVWISIMKRMSSFLSAVTRPMRCFWNLFPRPGLIVSTSLRESGFRPCRWKSASIVIQSMTVIGSWIGSIIDQAGNCPVPNG